MKTLPQPLAKLLFILIIISTVACFAVAYVSGVFLWIYFFDEPGPEQGYETIMVATVMSPVPLLLGLICSFHIMKRPRWIWAVLIAALALLVGAIVAVSITRQRNTQEQLLIHRTDMPPENTQYGQRLRFDSACA